MIATGRIDMVVEVTHYLYVLELKLSNNGGISAAEAQIKAKQYVEPFQGRQAQSDSPGRGAGRTGKGADRLEGSGIKKRKGKSIIP